MPMLTVVGDQTADEGAPLDLFDIGTFSDVVEGTTGGGSSIGLDPDAFTSLGAFDPVVDVVIDTDALTVSGGGGTGTTVSADVGFGSYDIAVFTFDSFELDAGRTLTATGSRPLAILSQADLTVDGTIDVSANVFGGFTIGYQLAGPGGGDGGLGNSVPTVADGDAAAGAPANSAGEVIGAGGGVGGGHGGAGGRAENGSGGLSGIQGLAFGDLSLGIQGGSGGATAGVAVSGNLAGGGGGGGGIELGAVGQITISATGEVLANGGDAGNSAANGAAGSGGGGAGGGILLHAESVEQDGILSAKGGNSANELWAPQRNGGGGGGGEILVAYSDMLTGSGTYDVSGGTVPFGGSLGGEGGVDGIITTLQEAPPAVPVIETYDFIINWGDSTPDDSGPATVDTPGVNIGDIVLGSFDGSHTYADNGTYTVTVTLNDSGGGSDVQSFLVDVSNVDPLIDSLTNSSPAIGGAGEGDLVTLSGTFTDQGTEDTHTATINWGDGTTTAGLVVQGAGTGTVTGDHAYTAGGVFDVIVTVVDDDTGAAVESTTTVVAGVGLNDGTLQIVGTNDNDRVKVFKGFNGDIKVLSRLGSGPIELEAFDSANVDDVEVLLGGGYDLAFVSSWVDKDATLDGGDDDDLLIGGSGNDVLIAGAGDDTLLGRGGRDLMIGGSGSDLIIGNGGEDILIAGTTSFDENAAAIDAIMAEWTSVRDYDTRVDNLLGIGIGPDFDDRLNQDYFLVADGAGTTVFDDDATDLLIGGRGLDLYFANISGDGASDIALLCNNEMVEDLEVLPSV